MAPQIDLDDSELEKVLDEVAAELLPVLKAENEKLAKAFPEGSASAEDSASPEGSGSPSASAEGSEGSPGEGVPPADPAASAAPPSPAPAAPSAAPASPPAGSPSALPGDPAQLQAMVASLPPEQQDALYMAAKQAIFARAPGPDAGAGAPPAPPSAPPMAPPSPSAPPAMKAEAKMSAKPGVMAPDANGDHVVAKSEFEALKNQAKEQGEQIDLLSKALKLSLEAPLRKAFTGSSQLLAIQKPTPGADEARLSPQEVTSRLRSLDRSKLSKSDRQKMNAFYDGGQKNYDLVKHLLQESN